MRKVFQVVVMPVSLFIVVQSVFAEVEKSIPTPAANPPATATPAATPTAIPPATPAAIPAPAKSVGKDSEEMQEDSKKQRDEAGHYSVCHSKPWLCE